MYVALYNFTLSLLFISMYALFTTNKKKIYIIMYMKTYEIYAKTSMK